MPRSLGSSLAVGSALWTFGLLATVMAIGFAVLQHVPSAGWPVHHLLIGFTAAILLSAGWAQWHRMLSPFSRLSRGLQAIREGTATHIAGVYPLEVQPLVTELNALLAQHAAAVARAQAKAGDLAHGLKTPLAVLQHEADHLKAAGLTAAAATIQQELSRMQRQMTYHLAHARAAASGATLTARTNAGESARGLARVMDAIHADRHIHIDLAIDPAHAARVHRADLDEMLGNLFDNACKWGRSRLVVTSTLEGARLILTVDDDGAGLAPDLRTRVLQRGVRADEAAPGTGLGLAIVADLADLYGGTISLLDSPLGGLRARLDLPAQP
jgi:signal transduction histidine kinase